MTANPLKKCPEDGDWERHWKQLGNTSFLKQSQVESPEKWQAFYDQVSDVWEHMAGISRVSARKMAGALSGHGLVQPGTSLLELGCGPGNLSIALAGQGCRVTAMDTSQGMIRVLTDKIRTRGISGIRAQVSDWNSLDPAADHDLAVAAFFPEACTPRGILRMEKLAKHACVLVLGNGVPAFPFYRQIWTKLMDAPCPASGDHLTCARNFLAQAGRSPQVHDLSLPVVLDIEFHRALAYFKSYFSMFGHSGPSFETTIGDVLGPHAEKDHIYLEGTSCAAMVCWPVRHGSAGDGEGR